MNKICVGMMAVAAAGFCQTVPRNAAMIGGGDPGRGKCTIEVVVDGAAEVEIRGASAVLRNLAGQPAQWRRFQCNSVMPPNPAEFRFAGVDGRGRQDLVRDPRNGGAAVIRIEDPQSGSEGYTFDIFWSAYPGGQQRGPVGPPPAPPDDRNYRDDRGYGGDRGDAYYRDRDAWFRGNDWRREFFGRIRQDLDHATSGAFPFTGDRARLERTRTELDELQEKLSRGYYDEQELDEAMGALQVVLQANRLAPRDRDILSDDLGRMRDFRERHEQYGARDMEGAYHDDRDQWNRGNNFRQMFFQHIREDLEHASAGTFPFGSDQARLGRTKYELDELQGKLARGFYDERELDEVIGALQTVVASNRLRPRDREILNEDLDRMRDFRERHEQWGAR